MRQWLDQSVYPYFETKEDAKKMWDMKYKDSGRMWTVKHVWFES